MSSYSQPISFHVIYTPNSVSHLLPLVVSWLRWTPYHYKLVANGLAETETEQLQKFCSCDTRLEYIKMPAQAIQEHGRVLTWLLEQNQDEWFAFMDSDILLSGPIDQDLHLPPPPNTLLFSGRPFWITPEETILPENSIGIGGRHESTQAGQCLGATFWAVLPRQMLDSTLAAQQISLDRTVWENLPVSCQEVLQRGNWVFEKYDTARVAILLLLANGYQALMTTPPTMHHFGGFSRTRARATKNLPSPTFRSPVLDKLTGLKNIAGKNVVLPPLELQRLNYRREVHENLVQAHDNASYFTQYLEQLAKGEVPQPEFNRETFSDEVGAKIEAAIRALQEHASYYRAWLNDQRMDFFTTP